MDIGNINRATKEGFMKYMLLNPLYFKSLSGKDATKQNIKLFFTQLKKEGLVAAANLPAECNHCKKDAIACNDCHILRKKECKAA